MIVDLKKEITHDENNSKTTSVKAVAMRALFGAPQQVVSRDKAQELYQKLSENETQVTVEAGDVEILKKAVDAGFVRGVSWQFAEAVDPQTEEE